MSITIDPNTHTSVLLKELVWAIDISDTQKNIIVDATLWLAWHAGEILRQMHPGDMFIGFDADKRNLDLAEIKLKNIQKENSLNEIEIVLIHNNFAFLQEELTARWIEKVTGLYYDLGVSSLHFDEAERGFSLRLDGPLDMRLDTRLSKTAADILNFSEEKELFRILKEYGEEPHARKIAAKLVENRKKKKFQTTSELCDFLDTEINKHIKTKMRVFQALRIEVNSELEVLKQSIEQALKLLSSGGNIFVISFHSLEDRIVKQIFARELRDCICNDIICSCNHKKTIKKMHKKVISPTEQEQRRNSRSRSAKARHIQKI